MASKTVPTSIVVVSPGPLSPTPSTSSAMKTSDPQSSGPSASLLKTEDTDDTEPAAEGDIQVECPLISCTVQV